MFSIVNPSSGLAPLQNEAPLVFTNESIDPGTIIQSANTLGQGNFNRLLDFLGDAYHNNESLVSDEIYDALMAIYEAKFAPYTRVGADPKKEKVDLPYYLGSLRKLKEEAELSSWMATYPPPYIVEDKIDGLTLLYTSFQGQRRLYTRGGGYEGLDVSHLLNYVHFPAPSVTGDIAVRGEIVLTKEAFARVGAGFKNARNLASGVIGSKKSFNPVIASAMSFYAYHILNSNQTPEGQLQQLLTMGFLIPCPTIAASLTKATLTAYFDGRKLQAPYEVDGLVIYSNLALPYPTGDNPKHVVAFKTPTETVVTKVTEVTWEASKDRLLKPIVHYTPVMLSGAELSRASGYNARFIETNQIGPGAQIVITRSGDVIPKILAVIQPAPGGPSFPNPSTVGIYTWNSNRVEFLLTEDTAEVMTNRLLYFIRGLDIKNVGRERLRVLVDSGIKTTTQLINATPQQLAVIGPGLSQQLYESLREKLSNVPLGTLMAATEFFPHLSEKRFDAILEVYPNLLEWAYADPASIAAQIRQVKGFDNLADDVAYNLRSFADWLRTNPSIMVRSTTPQGPSAVQGVSGVVSANLQGKTVVFSGFRDKDLESQIKARGGKVSTSVSGNTSFVILKQISPENMKGKAQEAQKRGVSLISKEDFQNTYLV